MPAIDDRRARGESEVEWTYAEGFHDGVERCATRVEAFAEQFGDPVRKRLREFAKWLQSGQVATNRQPADPFGRVVGDRPRRGVSRHAQAG